MAGDTATSKPDPMVVIKPASADPSGAIAPGGGGAGAPDSTALIDQTWDSAVALLHGSWANHLLCILSMAASAMFSVVGFLMMTAGDRVASSLLIVSMLFLLSQAFTLAKLSRDQYMAKMALRDPTVPASMQVFVPTKAYILQVFVFFIASLTSSVYSLAQLQVQSAWYGFGLLSLIWLLVASLCISKSMRDRRDANAWASTPTTHLRQMQMKHVLNVCAGSLEYRVMVWLAFIAALFFVMFFIWAGWIELAIERKGLLSISIVFSVTSCFHMAKLVRDRADPAKYADLQKQLPYQAMIVASFAASLLIPLVAIFSMNLEKEKVLFLLVGLLMTVNTTLNVAKTVRDKQEMVKLRENLAADGIV